MTSKEGQMETDDGSVVLAKLRMEMTDLLFFIVEVYLKDSFNRSTRDEERYIFYYYLLRDQ